MTECGVENTRESRVPHTYILSLIHRYLKHLITEEMSQMQSLPLAVRQQILRHITTELSGNAAAAVNVNADEAQVRDLSPNVVWLQCSHLTHGDMFARLQVLFYLCLGMLCHTLWGYSSQIIRGGRQKRALVRSVPYEVKFSMWRR